MHKSRIYNGIFPVMDREVLWFPYNILIFKCFIQLYRDNFEHKNEISNSAFDFSKWGNGDRTNPTNPSTGVGSFRWRF